MSLLWFKTKGVGVSLHQRFLGQLPILHLTQGQISAAAHRLSGESETLVVGVYLRFQWFYERTGARHALR
jgi:hypothetical protein